MAARTKRPSAPFLGRWRIVEMEQWDREYIDLEGPGHIRRLLKEGQAHKQRLPKTLFIPTDQPADFLTVEAERQGITVVRVPEDQLLLFIGEARESFRDRFGGGDTQ